MKSLIMVAIIVSLAVGAVAPALAKGGHGGGGGAANNPTYQKTAALAAKKACADNTIKCVGFGKKYYGQ